MIAEVIKMPDRIWNAAEYTRLSRDDGDKAESNSITSQKEIIRDYVRRHPEFVIVKEYADDGYSGVNFERPGFKQMMEDIKGQENRLCDLQRPQPVCQKLHRCRTVSGKVISVHGRAVHCHQ